MARAFFVDRLTVKELPPFPEPIAEEVVEIGNGVNLVPRFFPRILDPFVRNRLFGEDDVTGSLIAVARLANAANVAERFAAIEFVRAAHFVGRDELECFGKNAGNVRVALETISLDQSEDSFHLALVVNIFGEDVFVQRIASGTVNEEVAIFLVRSRPFGNG